MRRLSSPAGAMVSERIPLGPLRRDAAAAVLMCRAQREIGAGELAAAAWLLRGAMDVDPQSLAARLAFADCLIDQRQWGGAIDVLHPARELARRFNDRAGLAACGQRLAAVLLQTGRRSDARRVLQQVIRDELESRGVLSSTTLVHLARAMRGRWSIARRWRLLRGSSRIARGEERVAVLRATGRLFLETGDWDPALRAFDEAVGVAERLRLPPARVAATMSDQGLALVKVGRYKAAVGVLRHAAKLHAKVGNTLWARKLERLSHRTLRAQRRVDEIAEQN